ncbi:unnamed product, partial [Ostreococcus tauri]
MAFLDRCRALDNDDANALVEAFCASERLDGQFCEDAFDCVYAAHARNAPEEELRTMMSLARLFMRRYRARETPARWRAVDAATTAARDAARAGVPGDAARDAIRRAVADVPDVTARDFMDAMREFRIK